MKERFLAKVSPCPMSRRAPRQPLDPRFARGAGVDREGTLWVDGNARGIKTAPASDAFREGWDRVFGKKSRALED